MRPGGSIAFPAKMPGDLGVGGRVAVVRFFIGSDIVVHGKAYCSFSWHVVVCALSSLAEFCVEFVF